MLVVLAISRRDFPCVVRAAVSAAPIFMAARGRVGTSGQGVSRSPKSESIGLMERCIGGSVQSLDQAFGLVPASSPTIPHGTSPAATSSARTYASNSTRAGTPVFARDLRVSNASSSGQGSNTTPQDAASARRCCVNRNWHRALPRVGSSPIDRERLWSTKLGHSIEHVARKHRFDSLRCASPTSKSIAENRLVPEEHVLDAGLSMIADASGKHTLRSLARRWLTLADEITTHDLTPRPTHRRDVAHPPGGLRRWRQHRRRDVNYLRG